MYYRTPDLLQQQLLWHQASQPEAAIPQDLLLDLLGEDLLNKPGLDPDISEPASTNGAGSGVVGCQMVSLNLGSRWSDCTSGDATIMILRPTGQIGESTFMPERTGLHILCS